MSLEVIEKSLRLRPSETIQSACMTSRARPGGMPKKAARGFTRGLPKRSGYGEELARSGASEFDPFCGLLGPRP